MRFRVPLTNIYLDTDAGSHNAVAAAVTGIMQAKIKTIAVVTGDWTGDTTGYRNASDYVNAQAQYADVEHGMSSGTAVCIAVRGATDFIDLMLLDQQIIDADTTRIWIRADSAPSYTCLCLFVAG